MCVRVGNGGGGYLILSKVNSQVAEDYLLYMPRNPNEVIATKT